MKVEKQGRAECLLASMAALRGVPLESVRKRAIAIACTDRWETIATEKSIVAVRLFWHTIRILAEEMDIPFELTDNKDYQFTSTGAFNTDYKVLPPNKKGIISFALKYEGQLSFHACPFENERVFDPDTDTIREDGLPLDDYIKHQENYYQGVKYTVSNIGVLEE